MSSKHDVWVDARNFWSIVKNYKDEPAQLFRELILDCVPPTLLALPFITAAGTKDTVGIPKDIVKAARSKSLH